MADDAELAFLRSQEQEYDPSAAWPAADNQDNAGDEEYDPASIMATADEPVQQSASPPSADNEGENGLKPVSADTSAAPTPSKQPRTIGGFVDESEDEEEEPVAAPKVAAPALLRASEAAETPQRSVTNTPNNTLPTPDVQLHSAQDQGVPSVSASVAVNESAPSFASVPVNGTTPVPDATKPAGSLTIDPARQATASVTPAPLSASLPKARLPQDRIGILNDRIQEDPRGDIEAWLSLIEEQRKRHKYDEARDAFNRFLEQIPTAVRIDDRNLNSAAKITRAKYGLIISISRRSSTSFQEWSNYLQKRYQMAHTSLYSNAISILCAADSTLQMTLLAKVERRLSWHTNTCWTKWVLTLTLASSGSTISSCKRQRLGYSAVQTGRICRRWTPYASCTRRRCLSQREQRWRFGVITIGLKWGSIRSR